MTPAPVGGTGTAVFTAGNVANPTTLSPGTGSGYAVGDLILCFTACRSATPTVATPSGWTSLLNVTGTNGRLALFGKIAASTTEAAPSVVWSGLTTGTSGTPAGAICCPFTGMPSSLTGVVDVTGTVENGAASATVIASGNSVTTTVTEDLVLTLATRLDDAGAWTAPTGYSLVTTAMATTSGADFAAGWAYKVKSPAGSEAPADFALSGGSSFASSGVVVALKPLVATPLLRQRAFRGRTASATAGAAINGAFV